MVFRQILKMSATILCGSSIVVLLGWWLGGEYAADRMRRRQSERQDVQTASLQRRVKTIQVGQPLPPIVVWSVTGAESYDIRDLLLDGGIILVVSTECDACLESSEELIVNKATSWRQYVETIIVGDHVLGLAGFVQKLRERGVFTAVYCDVQETLRRVHEITPNPAYFLLGTSGIVLDFGADVPAAAALTTFFNK